MSSVCFVADLAGLYRTIFFLGQKFSLTEFLPASRGIEASLQNASCRVDKRTRRVASRRSRAKLVPCAANAAAARGRARNTACYATGMNAPLFLSTYQHREPLTLLLREEVSAYGTEGPEPETTTDWKQAHERIV